MIPSKDGELTLEKAVMRARQTELVRQDLVYYLLPSAEAIIRGRRLLEGGDNKLLLHNENFCSITTSTPEGATLAPFF